MRRPQPRPLQQRGKVHFAEGGIQLHKPHKDSGIRDVHLFSRADIWPYLPTSFTALSPLPLLSDQCNTQPSHMELSLLQ